jgi:hypothetical protein
MPLYDLLANPKAQPIAADALGRIKRVDPEAHAGLVSSASHAQVHRTKAVLCMMPPLLLDL